MSAAALLDCAPAPSTSIRGRTAWIAISEPAQARVIADSIGEAGWAVLCIVHDLDSLQRLAAATEDLPDLLVSGLLFDDGDGFQLIRHVSKRRRPPALFVVSHQQRAVIKAAVSLADACGLQVAGTSEHPLDVAGIARSLEGFEPRRVVRAARPAVRPLEHDELLSLFDRGALYPWMQPKMRIDTSEVVGFEALMRAHDDQGTLIMPDRLISALTAHGLLDEATMRMARQTVGFVATALGEGMAVSASINVSMQSLSNLAFCQELALAVEHAQLDPSWITIEITETDAMADLASVIENTGRIRLLGFNLAIDDFGTAYSSLSQLSRIPFSELKIERAFVSSAHQDSGKQAIVRACAQLGGSLGLHVVAEGVESLDELDVVRRAGCSQVQGYLVSRPMPADRALGWLRDLTDQRFELPVRPAG